MVTLNSQTQKEKVKIMKGGREIILECDISNGKYNCMVKRVRVSNRLKPIAHIVFLLALSVLVFKKDITRQGETLFPYSVLNIASR